jgi:hypothetical protein
MTNSSMQHWFNLKVFMNDFWVNDTTNFDVSLLLQHQIVQHAQK